MTVAKVKKNRSDCNENQARTAIKMRPICLTDFNNNYIIYEIKLREKICYKREKTVDDNCK